MLPFLFQPLRLDIKRKLTARSDRVKSCDLHPTENWMLASLYNGNVHIWNIETQTLVKSFEVCDLPVRCARFVARKSWVVVGSDDMQVSLTIINVYCLVNIPLCRMYPTVSSRKLIYLHSIGARLQLQYVGACRGV